MGSNAPEITILHFNDVYNIEPQRVEPVGGAARFKTAIDERKHLDPLVLFSGDAFNPSLMSTINKGKQMVPVLNAIGVHCAVYGNHDFDHGVDALVKLANDSTFPWLLSNVFDEMTDEPLAEGKQTYIIDWKGKKIGLLGLVEEEWIATLATIDPDEINYTDYVEEGTRLAKQLKQQGCDYIIALTHMRWPNDTRLAEEVDDIDLILGGHDHDFTVKLINGKYVIKSGTDFRQMCQVTLVFDPNDKVKVTTQEITIDSSIEPNPEVELIVENYCKVMRERMELILGHIEVELDGRFSAIRTQETNLGNFITDIMLECTDADFAILNSGTLRSDRIHPRGDFSNRDLLSILPMTDPVVVVRITGAQVVDLLENGVSQYPALEGRFPQVSGITFGFDPSAKSGNRIDARFIRIQGKYLDLGKHYKVATKHYLSQGKDGYTVFLDGDITLNDEEGPILSVGVQNHFKSVQILKGQKKQMSHHRQSLVAVNKRKSLVKQMSLHEEEFQVLQSPSMAKRLSLASPSGKRLLLRRRSSIESVEHELMSNIVAPKVEGRIFHLDHMKIRHLEKTRLAEEVQRTPITEEDETPSPIIKKSNIF